MEKFVYIVMKNSDFTEGRGPMYIHKLFRNIENAREYIKKQSGIFGSPQCCYHDICSEDCEVWNGYDIKIMKFED